MPHGGGLLHLGFGLFHQKEAIREATVDLFNQLRAHPVGFCASITALTMLITEYDQVGVLFLQALNHFQRYAYVRQAHTRERRLGEQQQTQPQYTPSYPPVTSRAHSNSIATLQSEKSNGF